MYRLRSVEEVQWLLSATAGAAAFAASIETGLLWMLAESPMSAEEVAFRLAIPGRRCHYWLQYLEGLGILTETAQGYVPSKLTEAAILDTFSQESWQHLARDEQERVAGMQYLGRYLSAPCSIWTAQGLPRPRDYVTKMRHDAARAREFTRMLFEVHQKLAEEVASLLDLQGARRILDVGGGSGVVSMALLRRWPEVSAVVVDQETVCCAGREIAAECGWSERLEYHSADLLADDLPGGFDVVMQVDVGIFEEDLYRRIYRSLNDGGRLVLFEHFSRAPNRLPAARLRWSFLDALNEPDFYIATADEVRAQLIWAGFRLLPDENVLSCGRMMLQAQKQAVPATVILC